MDIQEGLYWFNLPADWDGPSLVLAVNINDRMHISFKTGSMPVLFNGINPKATFVPSKIDRKMVSFVEKWHKLYLEMVKFYEMQDLTARLCIMYLDRNYPAHEATDQLRQIQDDILIRDQPKKKKRRKKTA